MTTRSATRRAPVPCWVSSTLHPTNCHTNGRDSLTHRADEGRPMRANAWLSSASPQRAAPLPMLAIGMDGSIDRSIGWWDGGKGREAPAAAVPVHTNVCGVEMCGQWWWCVLVWYGSRGEAGQHLCVSVVVIRSSEASGPPITDGRRLGLIDRKRSQQAAASSKLFDRSSTRGTTMQSAFLDWIVVLTLSAQSQCHCPNQRIIITSPRHRCVRPLASMPPSLDSTRRLAGMHACVCARTHSDNSLIDYAHFGLAG